VSEPEQDGGQDHREKRDRAISGCELPLDESAEERFLSQASEEKVDRRPQQEQRGPLGIEARVTLRQRENRDGGGGDEQYRRRVCEDLAEAGA
jgi:hypothetical protein